MQIECKKARCLSENKWYLLLTAIYTIYLLPFYTKPYYAPDMFAYAGMWDGAVSNGAMAHDGFSSLFLLTAKYMCKIGFSFSSLIILMMNAISIYFILSVLGKKLKTQFQKVVFAGFVISNCCFFYAYGKLLYEWPFTLFNTAVCLLVLERAKEKQSIRLETLFWVLLGLVFSWKPSNIFIVAAFGLYMMFADREGALYYHKLRKLGSYAVAFLKRMCFGICGYLIGNFGLILMPQGTLKGISAYPASCNFFEYLFYDRNVWDHVINLSFNISVINVITLLLALFIIPLCMNKYKTVVFDIFMLIMFGIFISNFSRGYTWHGFPFAMVVILSFWWILFSGAQRMQSKVVSHLLVAAVVIQFAVCHLYYVPLQKNFVDATDEAYYVLKSEENSIYTDLEKIVDGIDGSYAIDEAFRRYEWNNGHQEPVLSVSHPLYQKVFISENARSFWDDTTEYYVYIYPKSMGKVSQIEEPITKVRCFPMSELQQVIERDAYTISLYHRDI